MTRTFPPREEDFPLNLHVRSLDSERSPDVGWMGEDMTKKTVPSVSFQNDILDILRFTPSAEQLRTYESRLVYSDPVLSFPITSIFSPRVLSFYARHTRRDRPPVLVRTTQASLPISLDDTLSQKVMVIRAGSSHRPTIRVRLQPVTLSSCGLHTEGSARISGPHFSSP